MSKASDALRALQLPGIDRGIVNGHDVTVAAHNAGLPALQITYLPNDYGRGGQSARWQVIHLAHKTDPGGHWSDYGHKTFDLFRHRGTAAEAKAAARDEAIAWANETYGTDEWATVPGLSSALFPKPVSDYIKRALRDARKAGNDR